MSANAAFLQPDAVIPEKHRLKMKTLEFLFNNRTAIAEKREMHNEYPGYPDPLYGYEVAAAFERDCNYGAACTKWHCTFKHEEVSLGHTHLIKYHKMTEREAAELFTPAGYSEQQLCAVVAAGQLVGDNLSQAPKTRLRTKRDFALEAEASAPNYVDPWKEVDPRDDDYFLAGAKIAEPPVTRSANNAWFPNAPPPTDNTKAQESVQGAAMGSALPATGPRTPSPTDSNKQVPVQGAAEGPRPANEEQLLKDCAAIEQAMENHGTVASVLKLAKSFDDKSVQYKVTKLFHYWSANAKLVHTLHLELTNAANFMQEHARDDFRRNSRLILVQEFMDILQMLCDDEQWV